MKPLLSALVAVAAVAAAACTAQDFGPDLRASGTPTVLAGTTTGASPPTATLTATPVSPSPTATIAPTPTATIAPSPLPPPPATPTILPALVGLPDAEVLRGSPDRPWIALVFNVGAGFAPATSILDTLREKQYRASFFVMGWWAERQPDVLRLIAGAGHEIASHGHSVFDLTKVSDGEVRADLEAADRVIAAVTGRSTRPLWSPSAGYRDARVRRIAAELGFRAVLWTLDSGDWTHEATAASVAERVRTGVANGSIVVMHFDSPTTVDSTARALPGLIDHLRAAGYRLVTVTELLAGGG